MKVDLGDIKGYMSSELKKFENEVAMAFIIAGEEAIAAQTDRRTLYSDGGTYQSQTGNLASSTGYAVVVNGRIVKGGGFEAKGGRIEGSTGQEGSAAGKSYTEELLRDTPRGIALVGVAGMRYAESVQNERGKDVLATAELKAEKLLPELLNEL